MKLNELMKEKPEKKEADFGMYTAMHEALRLSPLERILRVISERKAEKEKKASAALPETEAPAPPKE